MFRIALSMIALAFFTGCGKETFISENIDLKIDFSNQLVLVSFQPITNYHIPVNALIQFQNETRKHSRVFLRYKEETNWSQIGSITSAQEASDTEFWKPEFIEKFPNGLKLPRTIRNLPLLALDRSTEGLTVKSLYQASPDLVTGGAILSEEFGALPKFFLGTQTFSATNGELRASISVTGPTDTQMGGIYFIANFGLNPFDGAQTKSKTESIRLLADGPMVVLNAGESKGWWGFLEAKLNRLASRLQQLHSSDE
jgi:hypothetical protein